MGAVRRVKKAQQEDTQVSGEQKKMAEVVRACVLVIGNEILSGRTQDLNVKFLGETLASHGILVKEVRIVPDDEASIIHHIQDVRHRFTYVFTTGGIGPTHDDITAACVSKAL